MTRACPSLQARLCDTCRVAIHVSRPPGTAAYPAAASHSRPAATDALGLDGPGPELASFCAPSHSQPVIAGQRIVGREAWVVLADFGVRYMEMITPYITRSAQLGIACKTNRCLRPVTTMHAAPLRPTTRPHTWAAVTTRAWAQFWSHSSPSGTVHRRSAGSCSRRPRTVADAGERWPALLESVLGATPREFESRILRHADLLKHRSSAPTG
jgi:hypothetical protein